LIELVRQPASSEAAIHAAMVMFESAGLQVVVSSDQIGRIINRLVLPKYNTALRFLDEGLATQADMDLTCKLGLGYPDGPIERVIRGGLANHYARTKALFDTYGTSSYAPPRQAIVAFNRSRSDAGNSRWSSSLSKSKEFAGYLTMKLFAEAGLEARIVQIADEKQTIVNLVSAELGLARS
jgi:3-hydroxyacyl-CoA dehydrogenase